MPERMMLCLNEYFLSTIAKNLIGAKKEEVICIIQTYTVYVIQCVPYQVLLVNINQRITFLSLNALVFLQLIILHRHTFFHCFTVLLLNNTVMRSCKDEMISTLNRYCDRQTSMVRTTSCSDVYTVEIMSSVSSITGLFFFLTNQFFLYHVFV